jgi:hypothetical protein
MAENLESSALRKSPNCCTAPRCTSQSHSRRQICALTRISKGDSFARRQRFQKPEFEKKEVIGLPQYRDTAEIKRKVSLERLVETTLTVGLIKVNKHFRKNRRPARHARRQSSLLGRAA